MVCFACLKQRQVTRAEFHVLEEWMPGPLPGGYRGKARRENTLPVPQQNPHQLLSSSGGCCPARSAALCPSRCCLRRLLRLGTPRPGDQGCVLGCSPNSPKRCNRSSTESFEGVNRGEDAARDARELLLCPGGREVPGSLAGAAVPNLPAARPRGLAGQCPGPASTQAPEELSFLHSFLGKASCISILHLLLGGRNPVIDRGKPS